MRRLALRWWLMRILSARAHAVRVAARRRLMARIVAAMALRHRMDVGRLAAAEHRLLAGMDQQRLAQHLGAHFDDALEAVDGGLAGSVDFDVELRAAHRQPRAGRFY